VRRMSRLPRTALIFVGAFPAAGYLLVTGTSFTRYPSRAARMAR
jgi:hypothetical protein